MSNSGLMTSTSILKSSLIPSLSECLGMWLEQIISVCTALNLLLWSLLLSCEETEEWPVGQQDNNDNIPKSHLCCGIVWPGLIPRLSCGEPGNEVSVQWTPLGLRHVWISKGFPQVQEEVSNLVKCCEQSRHLWLIQSSCTKNSFPLTRRIDFLVVLIKTWLAHSYQ